jgi:hypothetical protein
MEFMLYVGLPAIALGLVGAGIAKLIEMSCAPFERMEKAKEVLGDQIFKAAFERRPEAVAALKRLEEEAKAVLKEVGQTEVTYEFSV